MKLTLHLGREKPLVAVGSNQCHLLEFAEKYRGWHSFKTDRATIAAVKGLERRGYLEVYWETHQFKLKES